MAEPQVVIADDGQWRAIYRDGDLENEGAFPNIYSILDVIQFVYKKLSVPLQPNGFPETLLELVKDRNA